MQKLIVLLSILVLEQYQALRCPICRGESCDNGIVEDLDCMKVLTSLALPHNVYSESPVEKDVEYACLDLEYNLIQSDVMKIQQCFIIRKGRDVCKQIEQSLRHNEELRKCNVTLEEKLETIETTATEKSTTVDDSTSSTDATTEEEGTETSPPTIPNNSTTANTTNSITSEKPTTDLPSPTAPEGGSGGGGGDDGGSSNSLNHLVLLFYVTYLTYSCII